MEARLIPYQATLALECRSAIAFAPHPDDETFGCGGLLAALHSKDIQTQTVIVTSGDFGEHGSSGSESREKETRSACAVLGVNSVNFWREKDRGVQYCERLIDRAMQAIKDAQADLVLAPSIFEVHPDHRACAWIVLEAARRLSDTSYSLRVAMYEVGTPLSRVNALIDITSQKDIKDKAMACYASQLALQSYDEHIRSLNRYRTYTLEPHIKCAEAYWVLDRADLAQADNITEAELIRQDRMGLSTVQVPPSFRMNEMEQPTVGGKNIFNKFFRRNS